MKHIVKYIEYINEQALPVGMAPITPTEPASIKKETPYQFIFINDKDSDNVKRKKYPDGSISVNFPSYSVKISEISDWVDKNIQSLPNKKLSDSEVELRKNNIVEIIKGKKVNISTDDIPFIEKLKNAVSSDIFGKREPEVNVIFTKDNIATTDDVDVTFIKYKI
jgi:hypothetical protein